MMLPHFKVWNQFENHSEIRDLRIPRRPFWNPKQVSDPETAVSASGMAVSESEAAVLESEQV